MHQAAADTVLAARRRWGMESLSQCLAGHESHRSREGKREEGTQGWSRGGAKNGISHKAYFMLCKYRNNG